VKQALTARALNAGDRMPTVRGLARELRINPNTVARAYRELERDGLLEAGAGRGTFVKASTFVKGSTFTKALPTRLGAAERRGRMKPFVERLVSEARLLGMSDAELRGLVQRALREHSRPA
jgi:GntR family transcriptional regulator